MNHTPGPWRYLPADGPRSFPIVQRKDQGGFSVHGLTPESQDADARLIAAAPEMLRCLTFLLHYFEDRDQRTGRAYLFCKEMVETATGSGERN